MSSPSDSRAAESASSASGSNSGSSGPSEVPSGGQEERKGRARLGTRVALALRSRYEVAHRWSLRLPEPIRRVARALRHLPDRLLHPRRRRKALRQLTRRERPRSVLFVCVGNVCRSPYAERVLAGALDEREVVSVEVRSAGFSGWDHPPPSEAVAEAHRRGIELSAHRSREVAFDLVDSTDLFVVTAVDQGHRLERRFGIEPDRILHLGDLDPRPIRMRNIEDPWGKEPRVFRRTFDRIDRCVERLAEALSAAEVPDRD